MRGLKENVIIGRLIPAGTGFNTYSSYLNAYKTKNQDVDINNNSETLETESCFEDIILDDREARNIAHLKHYAKNLQPERDIL